MSPCVVKSVKIRWGHREFWIIATVRNPQKIVDIICIFYVHSSAAIQIVQLVPIKNNIKVVYSKLFEYVDIYDIHA